MPYQTLLFDLDNTLIDFSQAEQRALTHIHQAFFSGYEKDRISSHYHVLNNKLWQQVEAGKISISEVAKQRFVQLQKIFPSNYTSSHIMEQYEEQLANQSVWFKHTSTAIAQLHQQYKLGIITNGLQRVQQLKYKQLKLKRWFSCYVISEEFGTAKPNPTIFNQALQELQASSHETLMIGDSLSSDYQGAINSGIDFCWVNPTAKKLPKTFPPPKFIVSNIQELVLSLEQSTSLVEN